MDRRRRNRKEESKVKVTWRRTSKRWRSTSSNLRGLGIIIIMIQVGLGVVQNCRHYPKRTLFCDPSLPHKRVLWKCWFLTTPCENAMHHNQHFFKAYSGHWPLHPAYSGYSLKMMTILDDPLCWQWMPRRVHDRKIASPKDKIQDMWEWLLQDVFKYVLTVLSQNNCCRTYFAWWIRTKCFGIRPVVLPHYTICVFSIIMISWPSGSFHS